MKEFSNFLRNVQRGNASIEDVDKTLTEILSKHPDQAIDFLAELRDRHDQTPLPGNVLQKINEKLEQTISRTLLAQNDSRADTRTEVVDDKTVVSRRPPPEAKFSVGPGSVLKGRFELVNALGEGGMGVVYKAIDRLKVEAQDKNPHVAIKVLTAAFRQHQNAFIALQREASKAQRLAHPNIGTVFDFDREGDLIFMTMEMLEGVDLKTYIQQLPKGGLPMHEALPLVEGMARALGYAHQNKLIHSDFKPGNVFLTRDNITKVIDFGIARASKSKDAGGEVTVFDPGQLGALTPAYATYEMFGGMEPHPGDDIYALGCITYELLTGKHPYAKLSAFKAKEKNLKPLPLTDKKLSKLQEETLKRSVALLRKDRIHTIEEFIEGIRPRKSYRKQIAAAVAAAVLVVGGLGGIAVRNYLQEQAGQALIGELNSTDTSVVENALEKLFALQNHNMRLSIAQETRDNVQQYFIGQIDQAADIAAGRYDFARASELLTQAESIYPDSALINEKKVALDTARTGLLNTLVRDLENSLAQGRLLPLENAADAPELLDKLRQVDPGHPLLSDAQVGLNYLQMVQQAQAKNRGADKVLAAAASYAVFIDPVVANIRQLESTNLRRAHETLGLARKVWPDDIRLTGIRLRDLPKPSVYAGRGIQLAEEGKLNAADEQLREAEQKERGHEDIAQLKALIQQNKQQAEQAFKQYQQQLADFDTGAAVASMNRIKALWSDRPEYQQAQQRIGFIKAKIDAGARLCTPKLAGFGQKPQGMCHDMIDVRNKAPLLVVIPAGSNIDTAYAIGKHEISNREFNLYCQASGACKPLAGNDALPAVRITAEMAEGYAKWLSDKTGFAYHLATEAEWAHAAGAGGREQNSDYNCLLRLGNQLIKGQALLSVTSGKSNDWGLLNYVGNAQELVKKGAGYALRGGHYRDPMSSCGTALERPYTAADEFTGFRLVRALKL
jgi:serine/threonine protein kinase